MRPKSGARLEHAIRRATRTRRFTAAFFVDIDNFRAIDDRFGHLAGDAALRLLADHPRRAVRRIDTVTRYGGDEFVVVAEHLHWPDEAARLAARIQSASTFTLTGFRDAPPVSASIGATLAQAGASVDEVLNNADTAMYQAKELRQSEVVWFTEAH